MLKNLKAHLIAGLIAMAPVLVQPNTDAPTKIGGCIAAFLVGCGLLRREPPK